MKEVGHGRRRQGKYKGVGGGEREREKVLDWGKVGV